MGMSKQERAIWEKLTAAIDKQSQPQSNPAQQFLTQQALDAADYYKKGDFSQKPVGSFFDFQMPQEQLEQYKKLVNVGNEGTFALGDSAGAGKAMELSKQYLTDKFARDTSQNYQNNISNSYGKVMGGLQQASGYQQGQDQAVIGALQGAMSQAPKGFRWSSLLPGLISGASSVASAGVTAGASL